MLCLGLESSDERDGIMSGMRLQGKITFCPCIWGMWKITGMNGSFCSVWKHKQDGEWKLWMATLQLSHGKEVEFPFLSYLLVHMIF